MIVQTFRSLRRAALLLSALSIVVALGSAVADDDEDDPAPDRASVEPDGGEVLLARTAPLSARWALVPSLTRTVPAMVLAELDRARDPRAAMAVPALEGELPPGLPPPGWPLALPDAAPASEVPATVAPGRRIAALWALGSFAIGAPQLDLRVLEIRARYVDGIAIWINGLPVIRRGLGPGGAVLGLAARPHGPEWETFYVPVVPGLLRLGDNVIAALVHPGGRAPAPRLELEVAGRRAARVIVGPMVQRVGPTSAAIVVETDRPATVQVTWGVDRADEHAAAMTGDGRRHLAELTDLPPDARLRYRVRVAGAVAAESSLATAPRPGEVIRFAVYGDVRGGHATHAAIVNRMLADGPDAVLCSGDLVLRGTDEADWQRFFAVAAPLIATTPYYPAQGNHDVGAGGDRGRRFADRFALPPGPPDRPTGAGWYSFDVADVHVVALDSNLYDLGAQRAWLEADLAAADGARAILVLAHDGPFSRGTHGGNRDAARDYVPILARHHVTVLFSGHDHLYQRGVAGGVPYVVTGGGGAPLYPIACGAKRKPRCHGDDGMKAIASAHHYLRVTIYPGGVELCPHLIDGTPLEPCTLAALRP